MMIDNSVFPINGYGQCINTISVARSLRISNTIPGALLDIPSFNFIIYTADSICSYTDNNSFQLPEFYLPEFYLPEFHMHRGQQIKTLGELLHSCATRHASRTFLTMAPGDESWTYAEFEQLTNQIAHGLKETLAELPPYIAIMLENSAWYLATTYALKKLGPIEVSINRTFRGISLARTISLTKTPVMITSSAHFEAIKAVISELDSLTTLIVTDGADQARKLFTQLNIIEFESMLSDDTSHLPCNDNELSTAAIMFTSGTTGVSKGCVLSHKFAIRTAENLISPFRITADDVVYSPYPLSHIGPAYYDILPTMMLGGQVILRDGFSVSGFWPEVQRYKVSWFMMLGSVQQLLWAAPEQPAEKHHSVSRCWATPAPVPKSEFDQRFNTHLIPGGGYGSTDGGWVVVPQWDHPGGLILPEFEVSIVDDHDNPVPAGTAGEMLIRPKEPGLISDEYFGMPEETLESRRNLWFHTGDIAKVDADGLFYFICRKTERIRVKGEMVSGFEVEEGILTHPAIEDCAVIGAPSPLGEEEIKAFVVCKPGESIDIEALQNHCHEKMAKHMVPAQLVVLEEIPRTPTGKAEKGKLANL